MLTALIRQLEKKNGQKFIQELRHGASRIHIQSLCKSLFVLGQIDGEKRAKGAPFHLAELLIGAHWNSTVRVATANLRHSQKIGSDGRAVVGRKAAIILQSLNVDYRVLPRS